MDLVTLLVWAIVIVGIIAIGNWAFSSLGIIIPQPIKIIIVCVVAIVAIIFLASLLTGGGLPSFHLHSR